MTNQDKLSIIEELFEVDKGTLKENQIIRELDNWDSMKALEMIIVFEEEFKKTISANDIKGFVIVQDMLDFIG